MIIEIKDNKDDAVELINTEHIIKYRICKYQMFAKHPNGEGVGHALFGYTPDGNSVRIFINRDYNKVVEALKVIRNGYYNNAESIIIHDYE